ncbi:MAG: NADH-quinone oxidoreductase subunit M [Gammaproteobacteria bacterium]|nr:NADH-quinone oxidoreductase subunit M [Gammaproteobacteria bacterium]
MADYSADPDGGVMMQELAWDTQIAFPILAIMQLLPIAGLLVARFVGNRCATVSAITVTAVEMLLAIYLYLQFDQNITAFQFAEFINLYGPLDYHAAVDGISVLFLLLTNFLILIVSFYGSIRGLNPQNRFQTVVLGVQVCLVAMFVTLNLLWFVLISFLQFILLGYLLWRWATSPNKDTAFTRYLQFMGSGLLLMMVGTLLLGWQYAEVNDVWSFDLLDLKDSVILPVYQSWIFFLLFYGLAVRVPLFPLHGWLPLAVEHGTIAVAPILLLGLKTGIYGILRFVYPLLPDAVMEWQTFLLVLAVTGILYAALLAMMQDNLRRLLAYAVISHTGIVMIGLLSLNPMAFQGSTLLTINFGLAIAGLFFMTGLIYQRTGTTRLSQLGGLFDHMPVVGIAFLVAGLAIVGMPGTPGFDAAHLVMEGSIESFGTVVTIGAALGNVMAAGFLLWAFQRVFLSQTENTSLRVKATATLSTEIFIAGIIIVVLLFLGFYTELWLDLIDNSLEPLNELYSVPATH